MTAVGRWLAPPRFLMFLALFGQGTWLWHHFGHGLADAVDLGFDGAALAFLISLLRLFLTGADSAAMRLQSARNDANRVLVLAITSMLSVVIMAAITGELSDVAHGGHIALIKVIGTLILTWLFANVIYALRYAHLYYSPGLVAGRSATLRCCAHLPRLFITSG